MKNKGPLQRVTSGGRPWSSYEDDSEPQPRLRDREKPRLGRMLDAFDFGCEEDGSGEDDFSFPRGIDSEA